MLTFHDVPQRSKEWFALREGKWTGSTAIRLLQGKELPVEHEFWDGKGYAVRGRILEDLAIEAYEMTVYGYTGVIEHCGFITNPKYLNAGYSPDGYIKSDQTLFEVKCFALPKHNAIIDGNIPIEVMAQIQFGLAITGYRQCVLIAYNPDANETLFYVLLRPVKKTITNIRRRLSEQSK